MFACLGGIMDIFAPFPTKYPRHMVCLLVGHGLRMAKWCFDAFVEGVCQHGFG